MMMQTMIPKSWRAMKFYFTTVYQEIWVGVALTAYAYYKISYGGYAEKIPSQTLYNEMLQAVGKVDREQKPLLWEQLSDIASVFFQRCPNNVYRVQNCYIALKRLNKHKELSRQKSSGK